MQFADLATRVQSGDATAEDEVVRLFAPRIRAMAVSRLRRREDVEELVDDVLMAVLLALRRGSVRETESLAAFVYGTALRLVWNRRRALARRSFVEGFADDPPGPDPTTDLERRDRLRLCRRVLDRFPEIDRRILFLTLVEGLKPGEIASSMGLSSTVVRQRKSRAVRRLVESIRQLSPDDGSEPL